MKYHKSVIVLGVSFIILFLVSLRYYFLTGMVITHVTNPISGGPAKFILWFFGALAVYGIYLILAEIMKKRKGNNPNNGTKSDGASECNKKKV